DMPGSPSRVRPQDPRPRQPLSIRAWLAVIRTYQTCTRLLTERLRTLDLTVAQHETLAHLLVEDHVSQQTLAARLLVTKGNLTGLLNRLAERGLIERQPDPSDRRVNRIVLTAAGRALATEADALQRAYVAEMVSPLTETQQTDLHAMMRAIETQLHAMDEA
ncbi:MAG: MarR family transcriptional regulator, partial [Bacteroidota bacterium]